MKRSEMLEKIEEAKSEWVIINYVEKKEKKSLAEVILDKLEDYGMLPPINLHSFYLDGDKADQKNTNYHTWEEE